MTTARVLNVVPTLMCGGTENQFMALARTLDRTRFDVEFACLRRWGGFVDELWRAGEKLFGLILIRNTTTESQRPVITPA